MAGKKSGTEASLYELELDSACSMIRKSRAKRILIQLPEGLKPYAGGIADILSAKTKAKVYIWAGSCFGACDIPQAKGYGLLIQWGHDRFRKRGAA